MKNLPSILIRPAQIIISKKKKKEKLIGMEKYKYYQPPETSTVNRNPSK